jgi:hypothetical protein
MMSLEGVRRDQGATNWLTIWQVFGLRRDSASTDRLSLGIVAANSNTGMPRPVWRFSDVILRAFSTSGLLPSALQALVNASIFAV